MPTDLDLAAALDEIAAMRALPPDAVVPLGYCAARDCRLPIGTADCYADGDGQFHEACYLRERSAEPIGTERG